LMDSQVARKTENIVFPEVLLEPTEEWLFQVAVFDCIDSTCLFHILPYYLYLFFFFMSIRYQSDGTDEVNRQTELLSDLIYKLHDSNTISVFFFQLHI
jgi:hypothetical protein